MTYIRTYMKLATKMFLAMICLSCNPSSVVTELSKVEIAYMSWAAVTNAPIECSTLFDEWNENRVEITDKGELHKWQKVLKGIELSNPESWKPIDARICVLVYSKKVDIIRRFSFGNFAQEPYIGISGKVYKKNKELFDIVIFYLPSDYFVSRE